MNEIISAGQIAKSNLSFNQHEMVGQVIQINGFLKARVLWSLLQALLDLVASVLDSTMHQWYEEYLRKNDHFLSLVTFTEASGVIPSPLHPSTVLH